MEKINIVTVDSTTSTLKIGILINNQKKIYDINNGFNHLENIIPTIDDGLKLLNADKKDLTCLSVSCGPGSFTGIRIGIATMQALSYALHIPLFGFNGLYIYKELINKPQSIIIPVVDAKKKCFYCSFLNSNDDNSYDYTPEEMYEKLSGFQGGKEIIFAGQDFILAKDYFDEKKLDYTWLFPQGFTASSMLDYSINMVANGNPGSIEPIYLRQSEAEIALLEKKANHLLK